jgi:riboflavin kinase/FMN adenylyltransferase
VVNLGGRPTFGEHARLLEAHLIDVEADLYGRRLCVGFTRRLRGVMKFGSLDELRAQIARDRAAALQD